MTGYGRRCRALALLLALLLVTGQPAEARRGGRRRGGGRRNRFGNMPMIGTFRSPASKSYYMNPNGAQITKWSHFESEYILGSKIVFMCTASGKPRPHITWYKNGIEVYAHNFFKITEYKVGANSTVSRMEITPAKQKDAGYYECQADNKYAFDRRGFRTDFIIQME
ncbi:immunoglobulin domain-containing protein oig-4-like [Pollicipes pollicipes]|uniref:immunoglobulin domain-containing protein oig-4-like n=1 Tax=Pollicipes pollicipes TaxID=41117 RepID=UPI00188577EB|nr:immunoglobulin domain-containing protein oig-4-like [Pollicipes pollicipes]XP_037090284.1 immunoglobulin domain-containing protein oig-4-like [Pollicipes pollicipes]